MAESPPDRGGPIDIVDEFVASWNRHDMKALGDLFQSDADFVDVFGNWFKGRDVFEEALTQRHQTVFRASSFARKEIAVRRVSSQWQWCTPLSSSMVRRIPLASPSRPGLAS